MNGKLSRYLVAPLLWLINRVRGSATSSAELPPYHTTLLKFQYAPFPYQKSTFYKESARAFFDVTTDGRRGHQSSRGGVYWEDETYNDNRVLIAIPPQFTTNKPAVIVVYLHGNQATLERDVHDRQQIPAQVAKSGLNAILVAPQFAVDAQDSSPGHFADKDFFQRFLTEAAEKTGEWQGDARYTQALKQAQVILVAYSGGYLAAACALEQGGVAARMSGVILLDALYGQEEAFAHFIVNNHRHSFFLSCFTEGARAGNENLQSLLNNHEQEFSTGLPVQLTSNTVSFVQLDEAINHQDLLSRAWVVEPLADILQRIK